MGSAWPWNVMTSWPRALRAEVTLSRRPQWPQTPHQHLRLSQVPHTQGRILWAEWDAPRQRQGKGLQDGKGPPPSSPHPPLTVTCWGRWGGGGGLPATQGTELQGQLPPLFKWPKRATTRSLEIQGRSLPCSLGGSAALPTLTSDSRLQTARG